MAHPPLADVPIRSATDLTRRWSTLLHPTLFSARSLWLAWFDNDGRMLPLVVPIDELPRQPDRGTLRGLLSVHDTVVEQTGVGEGHLALALCRPGNAACTDEDAEWADSLEAELDNMIDGTWSLHLAAAGHVVPVVPPPPWGCSVTAG